MGGGSDGGGGEGLDRWVGRGEAVGWVVGEGLSGWVSGGGGAERLGEWWGRG